MQLTAHIEWTSQISHRGLGEFSQVNFLGEISQLESEHIGYLAARFAMYMMLFRISQR